MCPQQPDTIWRNRDSFMKGREEVIAFLQKKWEKENGYRLRKELFSFTDNKIAVQVRFLSVALSRSGSPLMLFPQFFYEWYEVKPDGFKQWFRCYGLEVRCHSFHMPATPSRNVTTPLKR